MFKKFFKLFLFCIGQLYTQSVFITPNKKYIFGSGVLLSIIALMYVYNNNQDCTSNAVANTKEDSKDKKKNDIEKTTNVLSAPSNSKSFQLTKEELLNQFYKTIEAIDKTITLELKNYMVTEDTNQVFFNQLSEEFKKWHSDNVYEKAECVYIPTFYISIYKSLNIHQLSNVYDVHFFGIKQCHHALYSLLTSNVREYIEQKNKPLYQSLECKLLFCITISDPQFLKADFFINLFLELAKDYEYYWSGKVAGFSLINFNAFFGNYEKIEQNYKNELSLHVVEEKVLISLQNSNNKISNQQSITGSHLIEIPIDLNII
ncbi:hypothetical protein EKK58_06570 [Candidatus Dependentiae bacterium]|nr:MAG: hypothetical protein EKK58_06570 [Candidatus Dependentiae bacterium]